MSRNISIKKVGVANNVSDVAHIKVPDVESGDIDFVPESDVTTVFKAITANGTYLPASDLGDGYIAVFVDVPVTQIKGKKNGQDTIAMVDGSGNIIYVPANS